MATFSVWGLPFLPCRPKAPNQEVPHRHSRIAALALACFAFRLEAQAFGPTSFASPGELRQIPPVALPCSARARTRRRSTETVCALSSVAARHFRADRFPLTLSRPASTHRTACRRGYPAESP